MSVRMLALVITGLALVTLSWGACNAVVVGETYSWMLVFLFFGGLIGGGAALAVAILRIRRPHSADAEMDLARGIGVAGMGLALGAVGVAWAEPRLGAALTGAVFILGVALTMGAFGLLAWAANGPALETVGT